MNDIAAPQSIVPTTPGTPFAGGIYAGRFFVGEQPYALIVAPKDIGELEETKWGAGKAGKAVDGASSADDGLANTQAMLVAGSALAKWATELRIGDVDGWYVPSRIEALIAFAAVRDAAGFASDWYWTSTQASWHSEFAWSAHFDYGDQSDGHESAALRARAVRRVPI